MIFNCSLFVFYFIYKCVVFLSLRVEVGKGEVVSFVIERFKFVFVEFSVRGIIYICFFFLLNNFREEVVVVESIFYIYFV